jgi:hypothetical protein
MKNTQTIHKRIGLALLVITSSMLWSACNGNFQTLAPPGNEGQSSTETIPTATLEVSATLTPAPSATAPQPTSIPPTATLFPTSTLSLPAATRINFAPGATYGTEEGTIGPGETQNFVLEAQQGQPMLVSVASHDNDVTMSITAASGITLLPASQGRASWQGTLPATQNYYIQVIGGASQENFSLWVSIPSRIEFSPGATSATVTGTTVNGNIESFVVAARGGQTMDIVLSSESNAAGLTVWGFSDGQPYIRAQSGATSFHMQLPSSQDYIIDVVPQGGKEVNFTLNIEIQ